MATTTLQDPLGRPTQHRALQTARYVVMVDRFQEMTRSFDGNVRRVRAKFETWKHLARPRSD